MIFGITKIRLASLLLASFVFIFAGDPNDVAAQTPHFKFLQAVEKNDYDDVLDGLKKGVSPDTRRRGDGMPALVIAAKQGYTRLMVLLLDQGANPDIQDRQEGETALIVRASAGDSEDVKLLIDRGADVNKTDRSLETALTKAVRLRKASIVRVLLQAGADPRQVDVTGNSPLDYALISRDRRIIAMLETAVGEKTSEDR